MKKIMVSFVVLISVFLLASCGALPSVLTVVPTTQPASPDVQPTASAPPVSPVPFKVVSIAMGVNPASVAGMACGHTITVTYTATFHVAANSSGGTVQFIYTVNNGRSTTPASLNFGPGETIKTYSFTWQGTLSSDNVYPGLGGVLTSSPNEVHSPSVKPTGTCVSSAAFQVTNIDLSVSPSSIVGMSCNSSVTFTYTVTFHVAPNSRGGTIQFMYTTNNGRSSTNSSVTASAGTTTVTYKFTSSGVLYPDHTFPGTAEVITTSPNKVNSPQVKPAGQCS
ncbi:MAG: hypothetical protein AUH89_01505 [Ktedonobacter sp. 13_1_40CM_4_52_4]|nr:MAG: hypothetical protein AUH89_01505 [Ktedonobacter sp. 13_1_40CM_4_52_4]